MPILCHHTSPASSSHGMISLLVEHLHEAPTRSAVEPESTQAQMLAVVVKTDFPAQAAPQATVLQLEVLGGSWSVGS